MRRRSVIAGLAGLAALPFATIARAQPLELASLQLDPASTADQSAALQDAMLRAASEKRPLELPAGTFFVQNLQVPSNLVLRGVPGATTLAAAGAAPIARIAGSAYVRFADLGFNFGNGGPDGDTAGLVEIEASEYVQLGTCSFVGGMASAIAVQDAAVRIDGCDITGPARAAVFATACRSLHVSGNRIARCGNGGIVVVGGPNRQGNAIITANRIAGIGARAGGNGFNGNAIKIVRCDDVVIADNQLLECAYTAVRLVGAGNVSVTGNVCRNCGEVAIVSEEGHAGMAVADNVIDGAASGISLSGRAPVGHVATCTGNVVRNIRPTTAESTATPMGIHVAAGTSVVGNMIHTVEGIGIHAGDGTSLRRIMISGNTLEAVHTGIAITLAQDPAPDQILVSGNLIGTTRDHAIIALTPNAQANDAPDADPPAPNALASDNLLRDAPHHPQIRLEGNLIGG